MGCSQWDHSQWGHSQWGNFLSEEAKVVVDLIVFQYMTFRKSVTIEYFVRGVRTNVLFKNVL